MSDNPQEIFIVQVYDTQEHSLQTQAFRTPQGVMKCVVNIKEQLDEMGGWRIERSESHPYSFDAYDADEEGSETQRKISVDVMDVWLND